MRPSRAGRGTRARPLAGLAALSALAAGAVATSGCGTQSSVTPAPATGDNGFGVRPAAVQTVGQASVEALDLVVAAPAAGLAAALTSVDPAETRIDPRTRRRLMQSGIWAAVGRIQSGPGGVGSAIDQLTARPGSVLARDQLRVPRPESWTGLPASSRRGRGIAATHRGVVSLDAGETRLLIRAWPIPSASAGGAPRLRVRVTPQHVPSRREPSTRLAEVAAAPLGVAGVPELREIELDASARGVVFRSLSIDVELAADEALILTAWDPAVDAEALAADWATRPQDRAPSGPTRVILEPIVSDPGPAGPTADGPVEPAPTDQAPTDQEPSERPPPAGIDTGEVPAGPVAPRPRWLGELLFAAADDEPDARLRDATLGAPRRVMIIAPRLPDAFTLFPTEPE